MNRDTILKIFASVFFIILLLIMAAPFAFSPGTLVNLDGSPNIIDRDWSGYGAWGCVYAFGDLLCHQEMDRSFILNGNQMPVCMRDLGLLIGFVTGLILCIFLKERSSDRRTALTGFLLLLLTLAEWGIEHGLDLDLPEIRFIAAILSGIGASMIIAWVISGIFFGKERRMNGE